ncbi:MAG: hypothetical protein ACRDPI_04275 [Nocardioidaceae bacterium]
MRGSPGSAVAVLVVGLLVGLLVGALLGALLAGALPTSTLPFGCAVGCPAPARPDGGLGDALGGGGSAGVVVTPARPPANRIFLYAFPWLGNASTAPVTVVGFAVDRVPSNVVIQRFVVLDAAETGGRLSTANLGGALPRFDVRHYRNYAGVPIVLAPGGVSRRYALVQLRMVGPVHRLLTGCVVYYRTRGGSFHQRLPCGLKLWGMR